ncbi:hypothetical protein [Arthrobacter sp. Soil763]|uniref:hypothetical protein n=1 Tax=Arthrobacter sp. Soil763 TaxID=1736402 RepID=UPI000700EBFC|nr:hypothetical protein [Arthrobacter sp. Soil763]KRE80353.1 hypothetical protein ASG71_07660 [Arthrobacter sp. Soil763]
MRPRILCISFSDVNADSRVLRQLNVLAEFGDVTTLSYGDKPATAVEHLEIDSSLPSLPQTPVGVAALALRLHKYSSMSAPAVRRALQLVRGKTFDLIVANEARALPLAHRIAGKHPQGAPIWGDMHEWAPEERTQVTSWRLLVKPLMEHICKEYIPKTTAISAVNGSIAKLYADRYGCDAVVVRNAGAYQDLQPSPLNGSCIRLVHSGAAVPGRNLEGIIEAVLDLGPGYSLDLYLIEARDGGRYWKQLKDLSARSDQIFFHDAVPPQELSSTLNAYDLGIYTLPPRTLNQRLMLPNKFFDFVQARLGVVFGPSPETSSIINEFKLGTIARDFTSAALADAIRALTGDDIRQLKANSHAAAHALSSKQDEDVEREILSRLLPTAKS